MKSEKTIKEQYFSGRNRARLKYLLVFFSLLLLYYSGAAQTALPEADSVGYKAAEKILRANPYYNFNGKAETLTISIRKKTSQEGLFYFMVTLVLYLALMRLIFSKYMSTLFTLFFRATLRQQQLREQLLQSPLPALLMNIFFVVTLATYATLLAVHFQWLYADDIWLTLAYASAIIAAIYLVKYVALNIAGWIFGISNATSAYLFIVFLINKMLAIFLLPLVILLAFPSDTLLPVVLTLSYALMAGMFIYRFIISYRPLRAEIKLNRLHFFLYICAFEIAPLLLIYKVLLAFVDSSL